MHGPDIITRSISRPAERPDRYGNHWQYHSRSDRHSKIACWAILFDLINSCELLRRHIENSEVSFGINHRIHDFKQDKKKDLDLVLCRPSRGPRKRTDTFCDLVDRYGLVLTEDEKNLLAQMPRLVSAPVGSVLIALEAKAAMTEHYKAGPRFYDELNSSHTIVHGSDASSIAGGFVFVNASTTFISPGRNPWKVRSTNAVVTHHNQPRAAEKIIQVAESLPRRTSTADSGFDALGILPVMMANDGTDVLPVDSESEPTVGPAFTYRAMIERLDSSYRSRFPQA